ncbi:MAG: esterase/lipase family protein [Pikeienuella sp.]
MRGVGAVAWAIAAVVSGCAKEPDLPDLAQIYARVVEAEAGVVANGRRPLITIPGTLGSRLRDSATGTVVWGGGSRGLSADPEVPEEARLIALPIAEPELPLAELRDGVVAAGVLDFAAPEVFGVPIDIEVYAGVSRTLSAGGFRAADRPRLIDKLRHGGGVDRQFDTAEPTPAPDGAAPALAQGPTPADYRRLTEVAINSFRFDYDWRRDLAALAQEFHDFVMLRKRQVAARRSAISGQRVAPEDVTFDLLAHSMGGLIARYYLMHGAVELPADGSLPPITWAGAEHFSRVVIVATPNAGSVLAFDNLVNGKSFGPFQPFYPSALLATHASVWQLFPRARHGRVRAAGTGEALDPLDPDLWRRYNWGLLDPEARDLLGWLMPEVADPFERRIRAGAHQSRLIRRAKQFQMAMDRWAPKPDHLEMFLVVGGGFATPAAAEVDLETGQVAITGREEGDGVVLRASVLLDERQGSDAAGGLDTPLRFDTTLFLPDEHVELTKNPVFGDNLLFWLLEQPRRPTVLAEPSAGLLTRHVGAAPAQEDPPRLGGPVDR